MAQPLVSENSFGLLTSSQESKLINQIGPELKALDPEDLEPFEEEFEEKYDIGQHQQCLEQKVLIQDGMFGQIPVNEEFSGYLNFHVEPDEEDGSKFWVYSQKLKKVFIEIGKTLPLRIEWTPPCNGLFLKAVMAFCLPADRSECVTRCHNHVALSNKDIPYLHHVMSCKNSNASYRKVNGHYSVFVPLGTPQPGTDHVQIDFTFHCKNSCSTGINRRPIEIIFTLENESGQVIGRKKLSVKICSCPKRDRERDERSLREMPKKRRLTAAKKSIPVYREHQPQVSDPDQEIFNFSAKIYGRENYETAKRIISGLMAETMIRGGPQAIIKPLIEEINRTN